MATCLFLCRRKCRGILGLLLVLALLGLTLVLRSLPPWPPSLDLEPEVAETEADFRERRQLYQDVCVALDPHVTHAAKGNPASRVQLLQHKNLSVSLCFTPKVGCTFWLKVFMFLLGEGGNATNPFLIDRFTVHYERKSSQVKLESREVRHLAATTTRVMFTRDPYSRLWSAYVDKFILPDFWASQGMFIMEERTGKRVDPDCPLNLTFPEFLAHSLSLDDDHWTPVAQLCQPCTFLPQLVGRMETFARDSAAVLRLLDMPQALQDFDHTQEEIRSLTRYYVSLAVTKKVSCLTVEMSARQLWTAFQMNGHLDYDLPFPAARVAELVSKEKEEEALQEGVLAIMLEARSRGRKSKDERRRYKHDVMARAYRQVNATLLRAVRAKFKDDFLMFGYEPRPDFIYSGRQDGGGRGGVSSKGLPSSTTRGRSSPARPPAAAAAAAAASGQTQQAKPGAGPDKKAAAAPAAAPAAPAANLPSGPQSQASSANRTRSKKEAVLGGSSSSGGSGASGQAKPVPPVLATPKLPPKPVLPKSAPQQNAPQQNAPQQNAPQQPAPQQNAPQQPASQQNAPQQNAPQQPASQQNAPQQNAPQQNASQQNAPQQNAPQQNAPQQNASQQKAPQQKVTQKKGPH